MREIILSLQLANINFALDLNFERTGCLLQPADFPFGMQEIRLKTENNRGFILHIRSTRED